MKIFLRAKHWQVFSLMLVLPLIGFVACTILLINTLTPDSQVIPWLPIQVFVSGFLLSFLIHFGWLWSVGVNLHALLPQEVKMNLNRFRLLHLIPFIVMVGMLSLVFISPIDIQEESFIANEFLFSPIFVFLIFIGEGLTVVGMIHTAWFVGKVIKCVETKSDQNIDKTIVEILLVYFFIVGIWLLQPRINKIIKEHSESME